ncbi:MAG: hypothetical protein JWP87_2482 [Labilithrix sp.]|nr:hypothetical protein [Labilithrix sp.]
MLTHLERNSDIWGVLLIVVTALLGVALTVLGTAWLLRQRRAARSAH